jgi:hypothetical protein
MADACCPWANPGALQKSTTRTPAAHRSPLICAPSEPPAQDTNTLCTADTNPTPLNLPNLSRILVGYDAGMPSLTGSVTAFFLYDVGSAIDLQRIRSLIAETVPARLAPKPTTPPYIQYAQPPIAIDGAAVETPDVNGFHVRFKAFDYGVISVALTAGIQSTWADLLQQGLAWHDDAPLAASAERLCRALVGRLGDAVLGVRREFLSEDYFVLSVTGMDDADSADVLLALHGAELAQLLRGEREPLSAQERDEVLRHRLSYLTNDLVVPTWNGAFVYDTEAGAQAALEILEFANSQLLEFRYYDGLLDAELAGIYGQLQGSGWRQSWFGRRYARAAQQVHSLFIDVNELTDKTENALKIAGDVYAARLFGLAAARLGLAQWKGSVREKLETLDDIYRFAVEQTAMARGEFLELTIVLILVLELVLLLTGIMQ